MKKHLPLVLAFVAGVALANRVRAIPVLDKIPSL